MAMLNRRGFHSRAASAAVFASGWPLGEPVSAADTISTEPCQPSAWQKHGIALVGNAPADRWLQNFLAPAEPLGGDRWRLWYSINHASLPAIFGIAEGVPGETMVRHDAVLSPGDPADAPLSIGNLPAGWHPVAPTHLRLNSGKHRLYFWIHASPVVRYLAADSDDGRRYRVVDPLRPCLYHPSDRAIDGKTAAAAGFSRVAGKRAERPAGEPSARPERIANDATTVYQLPDGTFEMYSVGLEEISPSHPRYVKEDNAAGWLRVIDRYTSEDGLEWTDRRRVIVPDSRDPIDQQFYYLSVTYTDRGRIGMLGSYRVREQIVDLDACYSPDGLTWDRSARAPWLVRGNPGEPDSLSIYAGHNIVEHAGRWHLFYTGVNYTHNYRRSHGQQRSSVMHASCESPWRAAAAH